MSYRKYGNKPTWVNKLDSSLIATSQPHRDKLPEWIRFDSKLEAQTYQVLPKEGVELQFKIPLKIATEFTPKIDYIADFLIPFNDEYLLVESKGILTPESRLKLNLLGAVHPVFFRNLLLVAKSQRDIDKFPYWLRRKATTLNKLPTLIRYGIKL